LQPDADNSQASVVVALELRLAAQLGTLDAKIASYRSDPETAPNAEVLRTASRQLFEAGDTQSARKILEFVFAREIDRHNLAAANFLGLAEIRIAAGDTPSAIELLRRLITVVGDPYQNMDSAAALLEKTGHNAEAIAFLEPLANSTPWESAFRLRLAKAQIAAGKDAGSAQDRLAKIAAAPQYPYGQRVEAASALSAYPRVTDFGSAELNLLASVPKDIALGIDRPFFFEARLRAAQSLIDARQKVQILSSALADTPTRDEARIPLFYAASSLYSDAFALASIDNLLRGQNIRQAAPATNNNEEAIVNSDETPHADQSAEAPPHAGPAESVSAQQSRLARSVGVVLVRQHRYAEALAYFRAARTLEKLPARRKEIAAEIADASARLRQKQSNAARQPILHQDLEQDRLVRPRLVANSAAPLRPTAKPGEKP